MQRAAVYAMLQGEGEEVLTAVFIRLVTTTTTPMVEDEEELGAGRGAEALVPEASLSRGQSQDSSARKGDRDVTRIIYVRSKSARSEGESSFRQGFWRRSNAPITQDVAAKY
jgi:hypothetical protein